MIIMKEWARGVLIASVIAASTVVIVYAILNGLYGEPQREVKILFGGQEFGTIVPKTLEDIDLTGGIVLTYEENYGSTDDVAILDWENNTFWGRYVQAVDWTEAKTQNRSILNSQNMKMDQLFVTRYENIKINDQPFVLTWQIPADQVPPENNATTAPNYSLTDAAGSGEESTLSGRDESDTSVSLGDASFYVRETAPMNAIPIATSIGIILGLVVFGIWATRQQAWGDATSMLLETGMHDMTVRDVEIVGEVIAMERFTIPELMKRTSASKITIWRTVQKLIDRGIVRKTEDTTPSSKGLGGRGKPSQVYEYIKPKE